MDWTLYIQDVNSNTVLSASGSGTSMQFNWDGNGFGETNLPAGVYTYLLSAQTNGEAESIVSGGSGGSGGGGPPSPDFSSTFLGTVVATAPDGSQVVEIPLPPSPPGMSFGLDQNGNEITTTTIVLPPAYFQAAQPLRAASSGVAFSPDNDPDGGGDPPAPPGSQGTQGPVRPPTAPVRGTVGTFGIAYQSYQGNGPDGITIHAPNSGCVGGAERVQLQGAGSDTTLTWGPLYLLQIEAWGFEAAMRNGAWNRSFAYPDDNLSIFALRGSGTPFNNVDLGLLMLHGTYGTAMDCTTQPHACEQMYFPIQSGNFASYMRMSEMNFGGSSPTNGLKWMAILACNSLYHTAWNSMQSQQVKPYNGNLHLLLGIVLPENWTGGLDGESTETIIPSSEIYETTA